MVACTPCIKHNQGDCIPPPTPTSGKRVRTSCAFCYTSKGQHGPCDLQDKLEELANKRRQSESDEEEEEAEEDEVRVASTRQDTQKRQRVIKEKDFAIPQSNVRVEAITRPPAPASALAPAPVPAAAPAAPAAVDDEEDWLDTINYELSNNYIGTRKLLRKALHRVLLEHQPKRIGDMIDWHHHARWMHFALCAASRQVDDPDYGTEELDKHIQRLTEVQQAEKKETVAYSEAAHPAWA